MMSHEKRKRRDDTTPIITPAKRILIGEELDELQLRLAQLRRETEVYSKTQPTAVKVDTR